MSAAANKKLAQLVYTDSANRTGTTFVDNLAEDVTWIVTGQYSWSHEFRGRDAIQNGLMGHLRSRLAAARPRTVAFNFIAEGDYVVVEARGDNVTKSGERYDNQYCMVWRIEIEIAPLQPRAGWMTAPYREGIAIGVKPLPVKSGEGVADTDYHVDGAGELRREDRRPPPRHHVDPDVRR